MSKHTSAASKVASVRFEKLGKLYHFSCGHLQDLQVGDYVIVTTSRGREMAQVATILEEAEPPSDRTWKPVERKATPQELVLRRMWQKRELKVLISCRAKAAELGLRGLKIARATYSFDGSHLTFYCMSDGDEKIDLKGLRKQVQRMHRNSRVDFRTVGPRDLAKIMSGMGACGMMERCCSRFLTEFSPISIKMAKAQGVSLNPQEITGMCGRLRCCLIYEFEAYAEARKHLPKLKKRVVTPMGEGRVVDVLAMRQSVVVQLEEGRRVEFHKDEIEPQKELKALKEKAKRGRDNQKDGPKAGKPGKSQRAKGTKRKRKR
ncbi:MAG: regulatory iron-sulfur-containing complex subunit RicT [Anaerolineales bacterium]|jgi:cell fate regulator YaaT (PSP1 superfamily)